MKLIAIAAALMLLAGFALGGDCEHDDCNGVDSCDNCTCEETVESECACEDTIEGCTGDCCTCESEMCDEDCTCGCESCDEGEEAVEVEESHCGGGCH